MWEVKRARKFSCFYAFDLRKIGTQITVEITTGHCELAEQIWKRSNHPHGVLRLSEAAFQQLLQTVKGE